jgi:carboxyl-terminal processing protease
MGTSPTKIVLGFLLAGLLLSTGFTVGLAIGLAVPLFGDSGGSDSILPEISPLISPELSDITPIPAQSREELIEPFWEAWDIVLDRFVDQPVDQVEMMRGAIGGMIDSLGDPHSSYIDPDQYFQVNAPLDGEYEGIGAWVDTDGEYLTIISPMQGSPAERAGLKPGDHIIGVDGEDVTGLDGNLVIRKVLGPAGTSVKLTIRRQGVADPFEVEVDRERITIPSVEGEMLEENIAYVKLSSFASQTTDDLRDTLSDLLDQDPIGLILDIRGNGGGFLDTAIQVTSEFIPEGTIVRERYGDGTEQAHGAVPGGLATEIPLVVLIDAGSASASEILAGAIQDYQRGTLIGETSFGKGSVQQWVTLKGDQGAVRVTTARWFTPEDRLIHEVGLQPDILVELTEQDREAGLDPQLKKAIELLTSEAG